jgi:hypothetical protein
MSITIINSIMTVMSILSNTSIPLGGMVTLALKIMRGIMS